MNYLSVLVAGLVCLEGCAQVPSRSDARESLQFSILEKVNPGTTTKDQILQLVGKPGKTMGLKGNSVSRKASEEWEYFVGDLGRLSVFFAEGSNIVTSWTWNVYEGDPEQSIKTTMKRFGDATWEPETVKWINPHSFPNECYFNDKKLGISIEYNRARKEVFSIRRWNPQRNITSSEEEKSPIFCIDTFCSPGYSAKEFFKDVPVTKYCELPN